MMIYCKSKYMKGGIIIFFLTVHVSMEKQIGFNYQEV